MDACHLLLGRPWQYDKNATHRGKHNTYSFLFKEHTIILLPSSEHPVTSASKDTKVCNSIDTRPVQSLLMLPKAAFEAQLEDSDIIWALITAQSVVKTNSRVPHEFEGLLSSFSDVF